jgi:hypothetical protein
MKPLIGVMLLLFSSQALTAQTTRIFTRHSGEFANLTSNPDSLHSTTLSVSRIKDSGTAPSATIAYQSVSIAADFSSETFVQIFGTIPATAFTGATTKDLILNLDTSTLDPATSFTQSCTVDLNLLTEVCGPVTTGVIQLEFQENGVQRTRVIDFNEIITNGSTTTHIRQKSDNSTANVSGSIFGTPVSSTTVGTSATVGVNHEASLEVIK